MNQYARTGLCIGLAAALAGAAYITRPRPAQQVSLLSDQGQPLAPDLIDPAAVRSLEVLSYDDAAARMRAFKVAFDGKRWVIPSENNYPADAESKMAQAAASLVGVIKQRVVTDNPAEHKRLGVIAPDDEKAVGGEGRGTRVTLRDGADRVLADVVIGAAADGDSERPGASARRYVRITGRPRVYIAALEGGFSTRFVDWVQTDLLEIQPPTVTTARINRYRVDERTGETSEPSVVSLTRTTPPTPATPPPPGTPPPGVTWSMSREPGGAGPQIVANDRVNQMLQTLSQVRISGVRPKPANLAAALGATSGEATLSLVDQASLNLHGFYLSQRGRLYGSEGEMHLVTQDGVVYSLWLGVVAADGTRAAGGGQVGTPDKATDNTPSSAVARYVMVTAAFDPTQLPAPAKPAVLAAFEAAHAAAPADAKPVEDAAVTEARQRHEADVAAWKQRSEAAKAKAERLAKRFADWYYLIDAVSLASMRPSADDLLAPPARPALPVAPTEPTPPPMLQPDQPPQVPAPAAAPAKPE